MLSSKTETTTKRVSKPTTVFFEGRVISCDNVRKGGRHALAIQVFTETGILDVTLIPEDEHHPRVKKGARITVFATEAQGELLARLIKCRSFEIRAAHLVSKNLVNYLDSNMLTENEKTELAQKIAFEALKQKDMLENSYTVEEAAALGLEAEVLSDEELHYIEAAYDDYIAEQITQNEGDHG